MSASTRNSGRRPASGRAGGRPASATSTALTLRPTSAPGQRKKLGNTYDDFNAWWMTPDDTVLQTPYAMEMRRPAAEELQQELTMTASVLRSAQSRLAEERESRLRARASEELAMVDLRRAKEEARAVKEEQRDADRQLAKALMAQRKELEGQLQRKDAEAELQMAQMQAERQRQAERMRQMHEDHARDLADQLKGVEEERDRLLADQARQHRLESERIAKAAADHAALATANVNAKLEAEKDKRIAHLQGMGIRRLVHQGLARGWGAWKEIYELRKRRKNLLKRAGYRLAKPMAAAAFKHWQDDWIGEQRKREAKSLEQLLAEEIALRKKVEFELAQVCVLAI